MIEIGAEATSAELHAVDPGPFVDAWQAFVRVVTEAGSGTRVIEPQSSENALAGVRTAFRSD